MSQILDVLKSIDLDDEMSHLVTCMTEEMLREMYQFLNWLVLHEPNMLNAVSHLRNTFSDILTGDEPEWVYLWWVFTKDKVDDQYIAYNEQQGHIWLDELGLCASCT